MRLWAGVLSCVLLLAACSGSDDAGLNGISAATTAVPVCTAGEAIACVGPGGCAGGQVCAQDGSGYGVCECGKAPDPQGGSSSGSTTLDSGSPDTGSSSSGGSSSGGSSSGGSSSGGSSSGGSSSGGSSSGGSSSSSGSTCVPKTCQQLGAQCGGIDDGCGTLLNCGDPVIVCADDGNSCTNADCVNNKCSGHINRPNNVSCNTATTSGKCTGGTCCTGCLDGLSCMPGNTVAACGTVGNACKSCDDANPCTVDSCAASGACLNNPTPLNGQACPGGVCSGGACSACGTGGALCCAGSTCNSGLICGSNGRCAPCGGSGQTCCGGSACGTGLVCSSSNTCSPCGNDEQLCCSGNTCNGSNLECIFKTGGFKCSCGAVTEKACNGITCDVGLQLCGNTNGFGRCYPVGDQRCY